MNNKFPEKLYHYCSISTFMSIIKNKCFWLSDTKYTNDKEELAAFRISVYETLSELLRDNIIDNKMAEELWISYIYNTLPGYISCFSENGDLLSQWRSYGDDGKGIAISIDFNKLPLRKEAPLRIGGLEKRYYANKVLYANDIVKKQIKEMLKNVIKDKKKVSEINYFDLINIFNLSYYSKNEGFREESEWRIIYLPFILFNSTTKEAVYGENTDLENTKFRTNGEKIISYFEFPFSPDSVNEVIVGPKNSTDRETLSMFLVANGVRNVNIQKSQIPYI